MIRKATKIVLSARWRGCFWDSLLWDTESEEECWDSLLWAVTFSGSAGIDYCIRWNIMGQFLPYCALLNQKYLCHIVCRNRLTKNKQHFTLVIFLTGHAISKSWLQVLNSVKFWFSMFSDKERSFIFVVLFNFYHNKNIFFRYVTLRNTLQQKTLYTALCLFYKFLHN